MLLQKGSPRCTVLILLLAVCAAQLAMVSSQSNVVAVTTPQDLILALRNGTQYIQVAAHLDFKSVGTIAAPDQPLLPPIEDVVSVIWGQCKDAPKTSSAPYVADVPPSGPCVIDAAGRGRLFAIKGAKAQLWLQDLVLVGSTTEDVPEDASWEDVPAEAYRNGGAVAAFNGASIYLERVWVLSSIAGAASGGGVAHMNGTPTSVANLTDVHLVGNSADVNGGGAYFSASNSVIQNVDIRANQATEAGYALYFGANSSSYITRIAPTKNTDDLGAQMKPQIMLEPTQQVKNGTNTTTNTFTQRIFSDVVLWGNGTQYVTGTFNATSITSPAAASYLQSLFKPDTSLADISKARTAFNAPPTPVAPQAPPEATKSTKNGLFAAKWRVAVIATCLSVLFCAMICICYFCYRIQRLNYERHYSFSTKMLQYDAEMAANSADVAVPMSSRGPPLNGMETPFRDESDSSVKLTVLGSLSDPRAVKTAASEGQSRSVPPATRPGGGLQVQELELSDYSNSGKLRMADRPLTVSCGGLTPKSLPPTPLRPHSGSLSALSPVLARSVPMTQLTPPIIRSPAASEAGNSATLSDAAAERSREEAKTPVSEPLATPSAEPPANAAEGPAQEMVSEKLADLLHLDEFESDPPRATPQNSSPSTTSLSLPSPSSTSYATAEMDDDADSGPLRTNGKDNTMRGNPLYLKEDNAAPSGVTGASPPPGSDGMDGPCTVLQRSISPPYDKHVKALKAEAFDAMPSSCSEYPFDKSEFRPHVLHGTRRMMDGPAIGSSPSGTMVNGHLMQPGAMEASGRGESSGDEPETSAPRQLKYACRGILDRRKPEAAAADEAPMEEEEGERPVASATKSPFSNPGGGWKRNSPFSRKTPGAQPGKLSGRSSRKKAQKRMMLNRAETPSASLFAISEEAEIRYTNGGVLYEVPAHEASMMLLRSMSSTSDLEAHLEEAEEEFDEQFSDSFSDSNEADNSSSVDSKDMDIEDDEDDDEAKNGQSGEVNSGQLGSDAPSDNQTFFYSPTKSDVYVDTTVSGNPFA